MYSNIDLVEPDARVSDYCYYYYYYYYYLFLLLFIAFYATSFYLDYRCIARKDMMLIFFCAIDFNIFFFCIISPTIDFKINSRLENEVKNS